MILNKKILKNALKFMTAYKRKSPIFDDSSCVIFIESDGVDLLTYSVLTGVGVAYLPETRMDRVASKCDFELAEGSWYLTIDRVKQYLAGGDLGLFIATTEEARESRRRISIVRGVVQDVTANKNCVAFGVDFEYLALFLGLFDFRVLGKGEIGKRVSLKGNYWHTLIEGKGAEFGVLANVKI